MMMMWETGKRKRKRKHQNSSSRPRFLVCDSSQYPAACLRLGLWKTICVRRCSGAAVGVDYRGGEFFGALWEGDAARGALRIGNNRVGKVESEDEGSGASRVVVLRR